jgi:hypothetical protein
MGGNAQLNWSLDPNKKPVIDKNRSSLPTHDVFLQKAFCHPERSEGSAIRHAFSPCKSANRSFTAFRMTNLLNVNSFSEFTDFATRNNAQICVIESNLNRLLS